jgi:hypothetical protein
MASAETLQQAEPQHAHVLPDERGRVEPRLSRMAGGFEAVTPDKAVAPPGDATAPGGASFELREQLARDLADSLPDDVPADLHGRAADPIAPALAEEADDESETATRNGAWSYQAAPGSDGEIKLCRLDDPDCEACQ